MSLRTRLSFPLLLAAALMLAAAPASANSWRKHDQHRSKHYSKHDGKHYGGSHHGSKHYQKHRKHYRKHRKHYDKKHHGHVGYRPVVVRHAHGYPVYHYGHDSGAYYCGPCNHYFDSYGHLSHHVHGHHGVAVVTLPSVIFQASIGAGVGWAFGY
jgi:hypothetical protein